jgi:ApaG protein
MMEVRELPGLAVKIDRVTYRPEFETPRDRPYAFAYFITIRNESPETVTIKGRKWVVTDGRGHRLVVEGDGVVGQFPRLHTGEEFSYDSHHVIAADSFAEGAYLGVTDAGEPVVTRIPRFDMHVPD